VVTGVGYVGAGGFTENRSAVTKLIREYKRHAGQGSGIAVAHAPMLRSVRVPAQYGRGRALAVFVIAEVTCPTTEVTAGPGRGRS
jgi:hypothetical protein